jgi:hypothetical protein
MNVAMEVQVSEIFQRVCSLGRGYHLTANEITQGL